MFFLILCSQYDTKQYPSRLAAQKGGRRRSNENDLKSPCKTLKV